MTLAGTARQIARGVQRGGVLYFARTSFAVVTDVAWDRTLGVRTRGVAVPSSVEMHGQSAAHASRPMMRGQQVIYATPRITHLRRVLRSVPAEGPLHLVDYGCGRGRALLLARQEGYASATGVELATSLYREAIQNMASIRRGHRHLAEAIDVQHADAIGFGIRPEHNVFYFYNPFGPAVLEPVLDSIERSVTQSPRPAWILYVNDVHKDLLDARERFTLLRDLSDTQYKSSIFQVES